MSIIKTVRKTSEHVKGELHILEEATVRQTKTLLLASLGFVAALAWNDAIQSIFSNYIKSGNTMSAKVIYAIIITAILVAATMIISKGAKIRLAKGGK